jgi:hypothetical protein
MSGRRRLAGSCPLDERVSEVIGRGRKSSKCHCENLLRNQLLKGRDLRGRTWCLCEEVVALESRLVAKMEKPALLKNPDGSRVFCLGEGVNFACRQAPERVCQRDVHKLRCEAVAPRGRRECIADFKAPFRFVWIYAEATPANGSTVLGESCDPRSKAKL